MPGNNSFGCNIPNVDNPPPVFNTDFDVNYCINLVIEIECVYRDVTVDGMDTNRLCTDITCMLCTQENLCIRFLLFIKQRMLFDANYLKQILILLLLILYLNWFFRQ